MPSNKLLFFDIYNGGYQKIKNVWLLLYVTHGFQKKIWKKELNIFAENCWVLAGGFHETWRFFEVFEIPRTGSSFDLFFQTTWAQRFFDSDFYFYFLGKYDETDSPSIPNAFSKCWEPEGIKQIKYPAHHTGENRLWSGHGYIAMWGWIFQIPEA